jgi:uncharacterized protein YggE
VQSTGEVLETIQSENGELSQNVLETLRQFGITDIKTFQYTIDKLYEYENGVRIDKGFTVRNIFEIRMSDMDQVGAVIDAAVSSGANVVDFIAFEVSKADVYYLQALNLSVSDAFQKAKSILMHMGITMEPFPKHIVENSVSPIPLSQMRTVMERNFTTPIEPGKAKIEASVTIEFIY